jgi:hypothetical protein
VIFTDYHVYSWTFTLEFKDAEKMQMLMDAMKHHLGLLTCTFSNQCFCSVTVCIEAQDSSSLLKFRDWFWATIKDSTWIKIRLHDRGHLLTEPTWEKLPSC